MSSRTTKTLGDMIRDQLRKSPDRIKALNAVIDALEPRPIREEVLTPIIIDAINLAISETLREERRWHRGNISSRGVEGAVALTESLKRSILDTWQIGSVRLGDATRALLLETAAIERESAQGHLNNASFYASIANGLKEGQKVRQRYTAAQVSRVHAQICGTEKRSKGAA